jgi:hypothetical protein
VGVEGGERTKKEMKEEKENEATEREGRGQK